MNHTIFAHILCLFIQQKRFARSSIMKWNERNKKGSQDFSNYGLFGSQFTSSTIDICHSMGLSAFYKCRTLEEKHTQGKKAATANVLCTDVLKLLKSLELFLLDFCTNALPQWRGNKRQGYELVSDRKLAIQTKIQFNLRAHAAREIQSSWCVSLGKDFHVRLK